MTGFWWGVGAFAALSLLVNLFDAEFREALATLLTGIVLTPLFVLALALDRFVPKGRTISPATLQRFAQMDQVSRSWVLNYRGSGVLIVRRAKQK